MKSVFLKSLLGLLILAAVPSSFATGTSGVGQIGSAGSGTDSSGLPATVRPATTAEKKVVLRQVVSDVMIRGALSEARKSGEKCKATIVNAVLDDGGAYTFEAEIDCSVEGDQYVGGGTVLMINVKGRAFGTFLDDLLIKVDKAG